jgi:GntR family transcriptional regulator
MTPTLLDKRLNRSGSTPLYEQLKAFLIDAINQGEFVPGERMPGERELEEHFQVSRITARKALSDLAATGYLRREAGRGTFLIRSIIDDAADRQLGTLRDTLQATGRQVSSDLLEFDWQPAPAKAAQALGLPDGSSVLIAHRLIHVDEKPVALAQHWINLTLEHNRLTKEILEKEILWDALEQHCGVLLTNGERTLRAVGANATEAQVLLVPEGTPLMLNEIIMRDARGRALVYAKVAYLGSFYRYHTLIDRH